MEVVPNSLELCLKLSRVILGGGNDIFDSTESHVRLLSSHEVAAVTSVSFNGQQNTDQTDSKNERPEEPEISDRNWENKSSRLSGVPLIPIRSPVESPKRSREESQQAKPAVYDQSTIIIDGGVEEAPKRPNAKFVRLLKQERQNRWKAGEKSGQRGATSSDTSETRLHKGMHSLPRSDANRLNPLHEEHRLAKRLQEEMIRDNAAEWRGQNNDDNVSQTSGLSAKEKILRNGHATEIPPGLRRV